VNGVPGYDPSLSNLRSNAITLKTNGRRILELIDEAIDEGANTLVAVRDNLKRGVSASGDQTTDNLNLVIESLKTLIQAASEALDLLEDRDH